MKEKFYITTPIYYASGAPHIGHAFTTIFADVISRYKRLKNFDVFFLTGMDEHGAKIAELAKKTPQEFVDELAEKYIGLWKALEIENNDFIRTTSQRHKNGVLNFFEKLKESGDIYEGFYEGLYCVGCEDFILERNLVNGLCPDHLKKPELIKEKNYFFNLKKYLPVIKEKIEKNKIKIIPESRKNEALNILSGDLPDFSITREKVKWGIPYPFDKNQIIYVWVEALLNYITALDFSIDFSSGEKLKKYWPADVHIIGAEINKFHTIFWPALLMSVNLPLPKKIFIHGLFTINGQKMSKTLGNIIDPEKLAEKFGADAVRYFLISQFPASEHGDIKEGGFVEKYNSDLANGIGNLFERTFTMALKYGADFKSIDEEVKKNSDEIIKKYEFHMENFELYESLREVFILAKFLDRYLNDKNPWTLYKNNPSNQEISKILNSVVFGIETIIKMLNPFMPEKMKNAEIFLNKLKNKEIKDGDKLNLFPRV
ncbi:methionine--tRNA ligase [Candidatus Wolfebacteria bacterium]|nr:methionine--tRNA ligase [Candidatus Wolfebacteria bacterium]